MGDVKVLPVPEGSIILLHNIGEKMPDDDHEPTLTGDLIEAVRKACGHDKFVVLHTEGDGIVEVLGPDDLVERVRAALDA